MIKEVRYKGQKVDLKDIEVVYTDHWGEEFTGDIEDYGRCEWNDAWAECEAGEGWQNFSKNNYYFLKKVVKKFAY